MPTYRYCGVKAPTIEPEIYCSILYENYFQDRVRGVLETGQDKFRGQRSNQITYLRELPIN